MGCDAKGVSAERIDLQPAKTHVTSVDEMQSATASVFDSCDSRITPKCIIAMRLGRFDALSFPVLGSASIPVFLKPQVRDVQKTASGDA